jgi:hypothetical protein
MNIAILGAGNIGSALGEKWIQAGHIVRYGVRNPDKPEVQELLAKLGDKASASDLAEAIAFGEVILFAISGAAMDETITTHAAALDGKIVIDAANKIGSSVVNSFAAFAAQTPHAKPYRAFNAYGFENFQTPMFDGVPGDLFYCGPVESRATLDTLITDVGLNPVYIGGIDQVEVIDGLLKLWIALVRGQGKGRNLVFKMLTRS